MNKKEIEDFIKFVAKSGVSEVSIEQKGLKLTVKNASKGGDQFITHVAAPHHIAHATPSIPIPPPAPAAKAAEPAKPVEKAADDSKLHVIKSPMIGTFYRSSGPDKPNFVNVGDEVKPGKVICILEAMKLFNEIECDVAGRIVKVLVDNATPVEYDQPLFLVEPA